VATPERVGEIVCGIVAQRGKLHNPVTGSGGMLIGTVAAMGSALAGKLGLQPGDRIATLVSLSLTPLRIDAIRAVHLERDQIEIDGQAVLFETGLFARLPADIPEKMALAILDVAGAPAQTARLVRPGDTVVVIGGAGKSGTLCVYEARKRAGPTGTVIGVSPFAADCQRMRELGWVDHALQVDATNAVALMEAVAAVTQRPAGRPGDQLRQHPEHRDGQHPGHTPGWAHLLLLHGHQLHRCGAGRRGRGQGHRDAGGQRLRTWPRRTRAEPAARKRHAAPAV
jgi:hypothetical protein